MNKILIPEQDITSLESIGRGVMGVRVLIVNVYAISPAPDTWVLVDCGLPHSGAYIKRWAQNHFGSVPPLCILLTHGHFDHTGAIEDLVREWSVPVYVHPLGMPYVTGRSEYPPPDPSVGGSVMALLSKMYPRGPVDVSDAARPLGDGGAIPDLPGWRWIHTPGHVSFFREEDRLVAFPKRFSNGGIPPANRPQ